MTAPAHAAPANCHHCGAPVEGTPFCCPACDLAWQILHDSGLEKYYATRSAPANRPAPLADVWRSLAVEEDGGTSRCAFQVSGLHCGACVWVVERLVGAIDGVERIHVSYATGRAAMSWKTGRTSLEAILGRIAAIGYVPLPLGARAAPDRSLAIRLGVAAFSAMNIMLMTGAAYAGWLGGMTEVWTLLVHDAALILVTPVVFWCATPFYRSAVNGLRQGILHMDLPVSIAIVVMYAHALLTHDVGGEGYLDSLAMLVALLLAGRMVEERGRRRTLDAAMTMSSALPQTARRAAGEGVETVSASEIRSGDVIEVGAGEVVAADGVVVSGTALVQSALLTGEAEPVPVVAGERVVTGAVVVEGALRIRAEAVGEATLYAGMVRSLANAIDQPVRSRLTDRIAPWFTLGTLLLAGVGAGFGGLNVAIAVLVVACPCALSLATPVVFASGLGACARRGLLVRNGDVLNALGEIDVVVFDKTGTVTGGTPEVVSGDEGTLRLAAGVERASAHPLARAILRACAERNIPIPMGRAIREVPGVGVDGWVDDTHVQIRQGNRGELSVIGVGNIRFRDRERADAPATVATLRALGKRVVLLSGDHPDVVERMARTVGIDEAVGGRAPGDKVAWIRAVQSTGARVCFVGDGLNDGPALAAADVGIAMAGGVPASVLVADAVVVGDGLLPVIAGLKVGKRARAAIRGNVARSLVYNASAVAAALAGLVNPLVAAVLMPLSSSLVLWGAARLDRGLDR